MTGIPGLQGIDHVSVTIPDMEAAASFYGDVLGGELLYDTGPIDSREWSTTQSPDWSHGHIGVPDARLHFRAFRFGTMVIELAEFDRPDGSLQPPQNNDVGGHHLGFQVADLDAAIGYLEDRGVTVLDGPIEVPPEAPSGAMRCRYFQDPWGNYLELTERP